jgi:hypothetical protein
LNSPLHPLQVTPILGTPELVKKTKHVISSVLSKRVENFYLTGIYACIYIYTYIYIHTNTHTHTHIHATPMFT